MHVRVGLSLNLVAEVGGVSSVMFDVTRRTRHGGGYRRCPAEARIGRLDDPLLAVLREGARRMLTQAIEAEVEAFLAAHGGGRLVPPRYVDVASLAKQQVDGDIGRRDCLDDGVRRLGAQSRVAVVQLVRPFQNGPLPRVDLAPLLLLLGRLALQIGRQPPVEAKKRPFSYRPAMVMGAQNCGSVVVTEPAASGRPGGMVGGRDGRWRFLDTKG